MRLVLLLLVLVLTLVSFLCLRTKFNPVTGAISTLGTKPAPISSATPAKKIDFATQIRPILEAKCQPCHFSGGKVYERLPFDRPETIRTLGTKLFTRIKDENERQVIRQFLSEQ